MNSVSKPLSQIAVLRESGIALHWLRPKSKAPVADEWSSLPVASVAELQRSYVTGYNLGARLGEPSRSAVGYWHVFDLDIRLEELADEAWAAFAKLFPGLNSETLPCVVSGSGGESRHLWFVSDKPFFGKKLAVSDEKFRRFDKGRGKEVWSYSWELELFGTGKQVVLPPSIHPDTGIPYHWLRSIDFDALDLGIAPFIPSATIEAIGAAETAQFAFETREPLEFKPGQMEADLALIPDDRIDDYADWVMLGQALHHQFGASDTGFDVWVEQSKRSPKFEATSLRDMRAKWRGFGRNRRQPVTMGTIRAWAQEARSAALVEEFADLPDAFEADADSDDNDDLLGGKPSSDGDFLSILDKPVALEWPSLLDTNEEGAIKPTLHNVRLLVCNDPRIVGLPQLNEFTQEIVQRTTPGRKESHRRNAAKPTLQLDGPIWRVEDRVNGDLWKDNRDFDIRSILEAPKTQGGYGVKVSDRDLNAAIVLAASRNTFHPVREYFERLTWDGRQRLDQLFVQYLKAPDDAYSRSTARLMMIAAVTRIFEPGAKFDHVVILEGLQGKRKSTFIRILAGEWFAELEGNWADTKQLVEVMQGKLILEIPELTGFSRADVRNIKAFISRQRDRVRLAYARRAGEFPRQSIFIGSTNDREYLKDDTGGRRFWPVECAADYIDTDHLQRNVDQLWAEAVAAYRALRGKQPQGTLPLYLQGEAASLAERLQESRRVETVDDILAGRIEDWLNRPMHSGDVLDPSPRLRNYTCIQQIWRECLGETRSITTTERAQIGGALRKISGWKAGVGTKRFEAPLGNQRFFIRVAE